MVKMPPAIQDVTCVSYGVGVPIFSNNQKHKSNHWPKASKDMINRTNTKPENQSRDKGQYDKPDRSSIRTEIAPIVGRKTQTQLLDEITAAFMDLYKF